MMCRCPKRIYVWNYDPRVGRNSKKHHSSSTKNGPLARPCHASERLLSRIQGKERLREKATDGTENLEGLKGREGHGSGKIRMRGEPWDTPVEKSEGKEVDLDGATISGGWEYKKIKKKNP